MTAGPKYQLPTPKERLVFVAGAVAVFLVFESITLGWFGEISPKFRLLMGHLGNYLEFLAAILGAFAFIWQKRFSEASSAARSSKNFHSSVISLYEKVDQRNETSHAQILEHARRCVSDNDKTISTCLDYERTSKASASIALALLGLGAILQILAQG